MAIRPQNYLIVSFMPYLSSYELTGWCAEWRVRVKQLQYYRECETVIRDQVEKVCILLHAFGLRLISPQRLIANTLAHWTNRVIEIKSRELDVTQRSNTLLMRYAHKTIDERKPLN